MDVENSDDKKLIEDIVNSDQEIVIVFDTSYLIGNGFNLSSQDIKFVFKLQKYGCRCVLHKIIYNELNKYLCKEFAENITELDKRLKKTCGYINNVIYGFIERNIERYKKHVDKTVQGQIDYFCQQAGVKSYFSCDSMNINTIMDAYFNEQPPFGANKKKAEFPDAIVLFQISEEFKNHLVFCISNDNDWVSFCKESAMMICLKSCSDVINLIQNRINKYNVKKELEKYMPTYDKNILKDGIESYLSDIVFDIDGDFSRGRCEFDFYGASLVNFDISQYVNIVEMNRDDDGLISCEFYIDGIAEIEIEFECSLYHYDSVDKDEITIFSGTQSEKLTTVFILTFQCEIDNSDESMDVISCKVDGISLEQTSLYFEEADNFLYELEE